MLEIVYRDAQLIAINKPHGLLVHRSPIASNAEVFALQLLRDQIEQYVYPLHRLDRKTAGVLLFALDKDTARQLQKQFRDYRLQKTYHAIVRGYTDDAGEIDYPLRKDNGQYQEAFTAYHTLGRAELPIPLGKHDSSRYSLVEIEPKTGRMHQIRKHMAHIFHPIIGDRPHGCNKQNRLFKERWQMTTMLLHASRLQFQHPDHQGKVDVQADFQQDFLRMIQMMGFPKPGNLQIIDYGKKEQKEAGGHRLLYPGKF